MLGCYDPDLAGEFAGDLFQDFETGCLDAIVIGDQNAIQHNAAPKRYKIRF
jgi:hypothetical protein